MNKPAQPVRRTRVVFRPPVKVWEDPNDREYDRWLARQKAEAQPPAQVEKLVVSAGDVEN